MVLVVPESPRLAKMKLILLFMNIEDNIKTNNTKSLTWESFASAKIEIVFLKKAGAA